MTNLFSISTPRWWSSAQPQSYLRKKNSQKIEKWSKFKSKAQTPVILRKKKAPTPV